MAIPALRALRRRFPGAQISVLARSWTAPLFAGAELVDQVIMLSDASITPHLGPRLRLSALAPLARSLRERGFDTAVLFQHGLDTALLAYLAGVPMRIGYRTRGRGPFLTHAVPWRPVALGLGLHPLRRRLGVGEPESWATPTPRERVRHQAYQYLELLWHSGLIPATEPQGNPRQEARLPFDAVDGEAAARLLARQGVGGGEAFLLIHPGTHHKTARNWLPERYAAVADALAERRGLRTLILGWGPDQVLAEEVRQAMRTDGVVLYGTADLGRTLGIIARASLLLSADSGPMHLAAGLGVPQVALFGSTHPELTGPLSDVATALFRPAPCSPCYRERCPLDRRCWRNLRTEEVLEAALKRAP